METEVKDATAWVRGKDGDYLVRRDANGQWHRSYGNEQWEFDEHGLMRRREASINDVAIAESDRRFRWAAPGPRPADVAGLGADPF